jgi:hypothetical protein
MTEHMTGGLRTRQEKVNEEWSVNWKSDAFNIPRTAARFVKKWIRLRGTEGKVADVAQIVNNTIDSAYEAYLGRFSEVQPRDIHRALAQALKLSARNEVRNAIVSQQGMVGESLDELTVKTIGDPDHGEVFDALLVLPESELKDLTLKIAVGKSEGMADREIAREIGLSHKGVESIMKWSRKWLESYYRAWLLDRVEKKIIKLSLKDMFILNPESALEFLFRDWN